MELDDEALREVAAAVARAPPPQRRGISYILPASHSLSYAHHDPSAGVPAGYLPPLPPYQYQHHPSASYSSAATSRHSVGGASDGCMLLESAMSEYGGGHPSPPYPTPVESSVLSPSPSSLASRNRRRSPTNPSNPRTTAEPHLPLLVLGVAVLEAKKGPAFWLVLETCSKKVREMARAENFAGDGCSGGEGQVEMEVGVGVDGKGVIECRICQEEGEEDAMDSPCACTGTLKFAHRKCIQRWCNKKGNITCEICNQIYSPNYALPPTKCCSDEMDLDLRQSWVGQIDPHDSHFLAIAIAEQQLLQAEFEDCVSSHSSGVTCCRTIALILMFLLLVRHVIVIVRDVSMLQDATVLFSATLQFAGFFLPCYVIARSCYAFQHRRRRQV